MSNLSLAGAMNGLQGLLAEMEEQSNAEQEAPVEAPTEQVSLIEETAATATAEETPVAAKPKRVRKPKEPKAEKVAKVKLPKEPKPKKVKAEKPVKTEEQPQETATAPEATVEAPKVPKQRIFFGRDKLGRMSHRLGADLSKFLVLDAADLELSDEALAAKHEETKAIIKGMGVKVANRAANLIEYIGGANRLNGVIERALRLLSKEGKLTSGDKGNLHTSLLAKPFTPDAARAMGNNTINMLKQLRLITEVKKQEYAPNGDSTLLALVSDRLALSFVDNEEAVAIAEKEEAERIAAKLIPVETPVTEPVQTAEEAAELQQVAA